MSDALAQQVPMRPKVWTSPEGEHYIVLVGSERLDALGGGQIAICVDAAS